MANIKIDREQVKLMASTGLSVRQISERLGCSEKQIRRIKEKNNINFSGEAKKIVGSRLEHALWNFYLIKESSGVVAQRFGVSRQAVWEYQIKGEISG